MKTVIKLVVILVLLAAYTAEAKHVFVSQKEVLTMIQARGGK